MRRGVWLYVASLAAAVGWIALAFQATNPAGVIDAGRKQFQARCAVCHGADGAGGERGPDITKRAEADKDLRELIIKGIPAAGMPGFNLPENELKSLVEFVRSLTAPAIARNVSGDAEAGKVFFSGKGQCGACHMVAGRGGLLGPDLSNLGRTRTLAEIESSLRNPSLKITRGYQGVSVRLRDGRMLRGVAKNESNYDLQLQTQDGRIVRLTRDDIAAIEHDERSLMPPVQATAREFQDLLAYLSRLSEAGVEVAPRAASTRASSYSPGDWPTYNGDFGGNRHSTLDQIRVDNIASLAPRWVFSIAGSRRLETTPVVVNGIMYVTAVNEVHALDASCGREIWSYKRPPTKGLSGDAAGGINRGVAIHGDRVFIVTDNAHLIALHRVNGGLLWDVAMADYRQNYGATSAPLVVGDLVISGTSGGDEGIRGFVAAYRVDSGERVWRFWTVPLRTETEAKTWQGKAIDHGCASTWLTGTYDPKLGLVYWPTGNPCPDFNGDERGGANQYSDSVVALESGTGRLRWYFQFTPHDVHDWDAAQTPMVVDADFGGKRRELLLQANRNGFFYVLDRATGAFLLGKPFVKQLTWARGLDDGGKPDVRPGSDPSTLGTKACPAVEGATNWMSAAYNPTTRLFYVMALEKCSIYLKSAAVWEAGKSYYGGATRDVPGETAGKYLRAIDIGTGEIAWELPQAGSAESWGGVLSTAGGLVFFCDDSGALAAVDARTGKPLWHFHTSQLWKASPMTYMADGKQYIAVAAGPNILAFALADSAGSGQR